MAVIFPDRIIAVRGTIENMSKAEAAISALLRECMEKDMQFAVQLTLRVCRNTGTLIGSRPSDHYFRSVCLFVCLFVQSFFSAVFDPISIKLGYMLYVWV